MENLVKGAKRSSLTRSLRKSARTNDKNLYVLPTKGQWGVKWEGAGRFYRLVPTKTKAIEIAKNQAITKGNSVVIIHNKDGRIAELRSYK